MTDRIVLDKNLLTPEQRAMYDAWQNFFNSPGWKMMGERFTPRMQVISRSYEDCDGAQDLGRLQGASKVFRLLFSLPQQVELEFLHATGQLNGEGPDTEDPVQPPDWRS